MKNKATNMTKTTCLALLAAALIATPAITRAQDSTNAPAAQTPAPKTSRRAVPWQSRLGGCHRHDLLPSRP